MTLFRNLRFGVRMLAKQPAVSGISIVALALGIGLTTTMYSIVHGALASLPFENPEQIWSLRRTNVERGVTSSNVPPADFLDWREGQQGFEDLAGVSEGTINVAGSEKPIRFDGAFISPSAFPMLRIAPVLGRAFTERDAEPGSDPVLLIGHDVWVNQLESDPGIVGAQVRINGRPGTIIGVMPEGFAFPMNSEAWLPLQIDRAALANRGDGNWLTVFGRVRDGVDIETATASLERVAERLEVDYPEANEGVGVRAMRFERQYIDDQVLAMLWTMQGAVFMVLLIACANVANLLLSRAYDRGKEVAVRTALGAGRWQIVQQFMTEVLVLAAVGGVLGLGIAQVGASLFNRALIDIDKPYWIDIRVDPVVLAVATGLVLFASLVAGLVPALQVSRSNLADVLKDETRGSSGVRMGRVTRWLVVAEMALSCGLLVGAGLMIKSVVQLRTLDLGFPTRSVFTARVGLFESDYPTPEDRARFFGELQQRLVGQSGVLGASLTTALPGSNMAGMDRVGIEGESYPTDEDYPLANRVIVTPGFFQTFETRVQQGRDFEITDDADGLPVAIVNRSFVDRHLAGQDPIGRRIRLGTSASEQPWLTIVGVVPDLYMEGVDNAGRRVPQGIYVPLAQNDARFMSLAVRAAGDPMALTGSVRSAIAGLDSDLPIYWVQPLQRTLDQQTWYYRVFGNLFMVFGGAALFLATIGLYGVISFSVRRRTSEVGIRLALGARPREILRLMLRQGIVQIVVGLVLGLVLATAMAGGLEIVLFQVDPRDPVVFAAIGVALLLTGLAASLIPAARASRVDPVTALRTQ